jgi:4-hydroxy-tetrahydrodipicolinate synthase
MMCPSSTPAIAGVLPVMQTPFTTAEEIDYETLQREIDFLFQEGVDGITIAMVSEVLRLTDVERDTLATRVVDFVGGRGPVIMSVGGESRAQALRHARSAQEAGVDALMAIPPSLTRCAPSEIESYYGALLDATDLPLIIQDASNYVGNTISVATQASIFRRTPERVMFKPEAQPLAQNLALLRDATEGKAPIFEGSGGLALVDAFHRGIVGTMPGADVPWAIVALWRALESGDHERAGLIHARLVALVSLMHNLDAYIAIEKYLLCKQGVFVNQVVRGPVGYSLDRETTLDIDRLYDALKLACGDAPFASEALLASQY